MFGTRSFVPLSLTLLLCCLMLAVNAGTASAAQTNATAGQARSSGGVLPNAGIGNLITTLDDPKPEQGDYFGGAIAVSGSVAVIGSAFAAKKSSSIAGAAYIYLKGSSGWPLTPSVTLKAPKGVTESFGLSVAISGSTIVVGAPYNNSNQGAAFVYTEGSSGWSKRPTAELSDPTSTNSDYFGISVATTGSTVIVGAQGASNAGAAYLYVKGTSAWPTSPTTSLADPDATAGDGFGHAVALSGTTAAVSAYESHSGSGTVYIYAEVSSWPTTPTTTVPSVSGGGFGEALALTGSTMVIGALTNSDEGTGYIYVKGASAWPTAPTTTLSDPTGSSFDFFASTVAVSGKTVVVGASGVSNDTGAVYVYVMGSFGWQMSPTVKIPSPTGRQDLVFGYCVAVSGSAAFAGTFGLKSSAPTYVFKA
jgi:hypothetical protein